MPGSSSHHSSRSFDETSALLPIETNAERPSPRASARSSSASPSAPDCDEKPIRPGGNARGAKVALRPTAAVAMPRQFGPTSRAPWARTSVSSCSWRATPSGPVSAKPAEMTHSERVPERSASSAAGITRSPGRQITQRSIWSPISSSDAVGAHPGDGLTRAVDGIRGAGEPAGEDVAEQLAADRAAPCRGADHGDGPRLEERAQRRGHRDVVALVDSRPVALGCLDREPHLDHAALEGARRHEAGVREHREHRVVLRQHLGDERSMP